MPYVAFNLRWYGSSKYRFIYTKNPAAQGKLWGSSSTYMFYKLSQKRHGKVFNSWRNHITTYLESFFPSKPCESQLVVALFSKTKLMVTAFVIKNDMEIGQVVWNIYF